MKLRASRNGRGAGLLPILVLLIIFYQFTTKIPFPVYHTAAVGTEKGKLEPAVEGSRAEFRVAIVAAAGYDEYGRRRLAPFQLCLACKCCVSASDPATCSTMPCCFGIDCQLPNKPFGVCAFVPKTCNCTSCAT